MTIERQPNGRHKVTVYVSARRGEQRRVCRTVDTAEQAEALHRQLSRRDTGAHGRTVLDAVDRYLELYGAALEVSSETTYRSTRAVYVERTWLGRILLDQLEVDDLHRFYAEVFAGVHSNGKRRSARTAVKVHRLISASIGDAISARWVSSNVCRDVKIRAPRDLRAKPSAAEDYDLADVARVLDAFDLSRAPGRIAALELGDVVHAAIATGAREAELAGLRWRDVDLLAGVVAFHGAVGPKRKKPGAGGKRTKLEWERKTTKTGKPRTMAVDDACRAMLEARYRRQVEQAEAAGLDADDLDDRAVFSAELELDYTSPRSIGARWRRAQKAAGVALTFHDLRHISASEMTAGGVPVTAATARTGHASKATFHDVYSHHRADLADVAVPVLAHTWERVRAARKVNA
jgi:integrase